jgi:hypothetical protein
MALARIEVGFERRGVALECLLDGIAERQRTHLLEQKRRDEGQELQRLAPLVPRFTSSRH